MAESISQSVQRLARQYVDGNRFVSSDEVLAFAMNLLNQFESRYHEELGSSLKVSFQKLDAGEVTTLNGAAEITAFFDDLMEAGHKDSRFSQDC